MFLLRNCCKLTELCCCFSSSERTLIDPIMAANFWTSSHFKQLMDPEEVNVVHQLDKDRGFTIDNCKLIKLHMSNYIARLAQSITLRQRKSMSEYDPRLVAPACLYLASKAEESTVQARLLVFYIKKLYPDYKYRYEIKDKLEMEMKILEALDYYLVVFHPYRCLSQFLQDADMNDAMQLTWGIVNDTYKMDLILIHPPHLIALACVYIASVVKDKDITSWFEELRTDLNMVKSMAMEILDFYDSYKMITDERVNSAMSKLARK